ncbi:hypothetical peptidase [Zafaria cholistanensis]|uniref:Hypothetical peptidase n=1 Tax=Zafaria cholistanensis TaxID=1682741 RepID=A0A5A7NRT5_9MICC|nr:PucR family transcriptional regulator [Zafaria cholistanensis]GER23530.1 hypothetical peptidase [Zafaria cholistanensis]
MRVLDLLDDPALGLVPHVTGEPGRLERQVTWCAPTEHMDPTPFLTGNALVLTTAMGLNFRDHRTWDAYVERLCAVPVSGLVVGLGVAHQQMPEGLVVACRQHNLPLLELPAAIPFVALIGAVWQRLGAERFREIRSGWDLADECTRLAAGGASLKAVLERIGAAVDARVTILDSGGYALVSAGKPGSSPSRTRLTLPAGDTNRFRLLIEGMDQTIVVQPLLGPVAAVLAMQLAHTLGSSSPLHSREAARFIEALYRRDTLSGQALAVLAQEAGFDDQPGWGAVVIASTAPPAGAATPDPAALRASAWRTRVSLGGIHTTVRFMEEVGRTTIVLQHAHDADELLTHVSRWLSDAPQLAVTVATADGLDELSLVLRMARRRREAGVHRAPRMDLFSVVDGLPSRGLGAMAENLLAPLREESAGSLVETLRAYLHHSGHIRSVCEELFIHRNTLSYRLRRIEELLGADLSDGRLRAVLLLALAITDPRSAAG